MNRYGVPTRRVTRDLDHAVLGGVCAGLARHFGLDPFWFRVATVLAGLCLPKIVLISYVVAWVAIDPR